MAFKKGIVEVVNGILTKGKKSFDKLNRALTAESECGFGLDYCRDVIHETDKSTGVRYVTYIKDGNRVTKTYDDYIQNGA